MTIGQETLTPPLPAAAPAAAGNRVMGLWPTLFFSFVTMFVFALGQGLVFVGFVVNEMSADPAFDLQAYIFEATYNGFVLGVSTVVTGVLCTGLVLLLIAFGSRTSIRDYLALRPVGWKPFLMWFGVLAVFVACGDGLTYWLDRPISPEFLVRTYETARFLPLFILALVVFGPVFEEVLFRGYMFAGIQQSRLGDIGAIVITALVWACIHMQYDLYGIGTIFVLGILLGVIRLRTDSLYPTLVFHGAINLLAVIETAILH